ncbi:hypothetical protein BN874_460041 [Candidatus Contendobacter odensis Run_B_J11]|uniref:Uncharacterized protein n=1 Tax=Candidatus Contendobacter odensis Run_B_J11 TaxID=1400861 RepID=A0A7U7GDI8_9GAMM|nr:hypothetical protein BN874_460041 [Candidatus Contendobacter odensis Run_B_J11]
MLLTAGQGAGQLLPTVVENRKQGIDSLQFLLYPRLIAALAVSAQPQIILDAERGEDLAAFGHLADASGDDAMGRPAGDVLTGEADTATAGGMETGQGVEQGGLAGAVAADQRDQFASTDR